MMKPNLPLLAFFLVFPLIFSGQSRWVRTYFEGRDAWSRDFKLSYDRGCLMAGTIHGEGPIFSWLVKTDINGDVLWEKDFNNPDVLLSLHSISQNSSGDIFLSGLTYGYGDTGNPIVVKLNACGEKEWCRAIVTDADYDYSIGIVASENGGCTFSLRNSTSNWYTDRICLMSFDKDGNFLWKECYNGTDTNLRVSDHWDLCSTPDKGFIISGACRYYGPLPTDERGLAYFVKTDSLGQQEWDLAVEKNPENKNQGHGRNITLSPDGQFYYASINRYHREGEIGNSPALVKISLDGDELAIYDLAPPGSWGDLYESEFINDSTLAVVGIWEVNGADDHQLALSSREGVILKVVEDMSEAFESTLNITSDNKIAVFAGRDVNDLFQPILHKFNDQLIDDTLYLQPRPYDSLCPYQILSETFYIDDCDIIMSLDEWPDEKASPYTGIFLSPNPCKDYFQAAFKQDDLPGQIALFNAYGQHLYSMEIENGLGSIVINTSGFPSGVIFAVFRYPGGRIETMKIIKI